MSANTECRCYVDHLIAEHRRLHMLLRRMRTAILHSVDPDEQPSFDEAVASLARLREELAHHFAQEEAGGCLDEAVSRCPRLAAEVRRIEAEHPALLAEIDRLRADALALPPTPLNQLAIQHEFDQLDHRLADHEKAENAVLAQAFGVNVDGDDSDYRSQSIEI